jgi:hypothetical protein
MVLWPGGVVAGLTMPVPFMTPHCRRIAATVGFFLPVSHDAASHVPGRSPTPPTGFSCSTPGASSPSVYYFSA